MKSFFKYLAHLSQVIAAVTLVAAHNLLQLGGLRLAPLSLAITAEEETRDANAKILKHLDGLGDRLKKVDDIEKKVGEQATAYEKVTQLVTEMKSATDAFRKQMLEIKSARVRRGGQVSDECAAHLGAIGLIAAYKTPDCTPEQKTRIEAVVKNVLGLEVKAALTSSDIPLPTQFSGEIVEFVYQYGQSRQNGTVYPLPAAVTKLPKLTTDSTFGLIASSATVTEKSPQIGFVTFTPEKFGGLIRLPSEIDEDSIVPMGQFLARYAARQIAYIEDWQFFMSTGGASGVNGTAEGLVKAVVTDSCFYYNGGSSTSGKTKGSDATLADFRNLRNASGISGVVLNNAKYYMHPTYEALLVSFNTSATVTPYQRGTNGQPATLDGFPIVWVPVMSVYSTSAAVSVVTVLFGDVSYQYMGVRNGIRFDTSRDAAFATDEILVRCVERLTVGLMASKAVAGLRNSAS